LLWLILMSEAWLRPRPAMLVGPDQDYVREQRDKIYTTAQSTPGLNKLIPPPRKWNDRAIDFGFSKCYLAYSGSTQRMSGRSCQLIVCSELDRYQEEPEEGATAKLIEERTKAFFRSLIYREGTPIGDDSALITFYEQSDQRKFQVPCPKCNWFQELRFFPHRNGKFADCGGVAGLKDKNGEWLKTEQLAETVHYVCERGCRWEERHRMPAIREGIWVPKGQSVKGGKLKGTPERDGRHKGWTLGSIYSPPISFHDIAREYSECREDDRFLRGFVNNWLGLKFYGRRRIPKWYEVGQRLRGQHRRGFVPPQALFLVAAVDVQLDYVVWRVRAFGEGGTSWGVDRGILHATIGKDGLPVPDTDLAKIDEQILNRRWPLIAPNALGQTSLQVRLLGIDSQYHTLAVHNWVRRHTGDRVRTIGGDNKDFGTLWRKTVVEKSALGGVVYPGGLERWGIQVGAFREELRKRWDCDLELPGAWWLESDILVDGESYLRQLVNRHLVYERDRFGRKKKVWKSIDGRIRHDDFDCEVYCLALGNMVVDSNWVGLVDRYAPKP
ncbi:MAG: phage terminase large subunit family protein, partial [Planctomycetaceae bacterium]|nr:phage terminase large subunit family protein [Planctomycetaceae bacterium]